MVGCTGHFLPAGDGAGSLQDDHIAIVRVTPKDTLESLAQQYLGDRRRAWRIADYNHVRKAEAGTRLVIPLGPVVPGGLQSDGYQTVPVLLYAHITADSKASRGISATTFESHLQFLREGGYRSVTLDELDGFFNLTEQLPPKSIVISFDSGRPWVYETAYPILRKYGFSAAVFVPTGLIDQTGYMRWSDLAVMVAHGFDIGANGVTGRNLMTISEDDDPAAYLRSLEEEIANPCPSITGNLKQPCRYFAYPAGRSNDLIVSMLKKNGYKAAFSRQGGTNPFFVDSYRVHRIVIDHPTDAAQLQKNLTTFVQTELR